MVVIENWDTAASTAAPSRLDDLDRTLTTVEDVGAYRLVSRNLSDGDRPREPVTIAEISAAAFRVARVPPLLGRYLVDGDEIEDAPPVVAIGYDEWQQRFAGAKPNLDEDLSVAGLPRG